MNDLLRLTSSGIQIGVSPTKLRKVPQKCPLDPCVLDRLLVSLIDRLEREVLVDLKALFALVARYELNLCVGETFGGQVGQHLMAE